MITVIQPDVTVPVDYFQPWLEECGHKVRIVKAQLEPIPSISDAGDGIVVLGGRMNVFDTDAHPHLNDIRRLIREAIDHNIPLFGICLGHQLLAEAMGGTVVVGSDQDEHGPIQVTLNSDGRKDALLSSVARQFGDTFVAAASHNDCVTQAPHDAVVLASSPDCSIQALRLGSAFSVQFHPEVSPGTMCRWHTMDGGDENEMMAMLAPHQEAIAAAGKALAIAFAHSVAPR